MSLVVACRSVLERYKDGDADSPQARTDQMVRLAGFVLLPLKLLATRFLQDIVDRICHELLSLMRTNSLARFVKAPFVEIACHCYLFDTLSSACLLLRFQQSPLWINYLAGVLCDCVIACCFV